MAEAGVQSGLSEKTAISKGYQPRSEGQGQRPASKSEKAGKHTMK